MKKLALLAVVVTTFVFSSCGGGGGGAPTPTPTSDQTKVASEAVVNATTMAAFATASNALENLSSVAMVLKVEKEIISESFTYIYDCAISGTVDTSGTVSGTCSESGGNWSCPSLMIDIPTMQFNDCTVTVTLNSTDYTEAMNGTGSASLAGSVSGTGANITSLNFAGTGAANTTMTGDIAGTAVMDIDITGSGVPNPDPDITCSGTVDVTTDSTTQTCTVNTDCSGCVM